MRSCALILILLAAAGATAPRCCPDDGGGKDVCLEGPPGSDARCARGTCWDPETRTCEAP